MTRCVSVIPTYNEAENLPDLIARVLSQDPRIEILFVDDASPDGTGRLADEFAQREARVHVLHRSRKEGLGPAYRDGLAEALRLGADFVIQMDADLSHPPESLPTLLEEIEHCDVVLGSRYLNGITVVNWPIERILLSYFGNLYVRKVTGLPISDTTGGFRCIRRSLLERVNFEQIRSSGYSFQIELNYRFIKQGARVREIPFFFIDRTRGTSKLTKRIGLEALWVAWWLRIADFLGRL
ncbi:polyprenol monophosphomannose synthase [Myxococcota bacterium]|nr:polyprenol monophosphomannose synthase [Myxococcota bacterium]